MISATDDFDDGARTPTAATMSGQVAMAGIVERKTASSAPVNDDDGEPSPAATAMDIGDSGS